MRGRGTRSACGADAGAAYRQQGAPVLPGAARHRAVQALLGALVVLAGCTPSQGGRLADLPPVLGLQPLPPSPFSKRGGGASGSPLPSQGRGDGGVRRGEGPGEELSNRLSLADAIRFALQNSPRLRSALAAIERAAGQEQVAFAPFLPQVDMLNRYVATSPTLSPGAPGPTGGLLPGGPGPYSAWQSELQLQWTLYDFGRTQGRYGQAVMRERIAKLQAERARQTVGYDVAVAYADGLAAVAVRTIAEESSRRAKAVLEDARGRRAGGVVRRDDVLRADVQLAEARDALVRAEDAHVAALARLNNVMGRDASLPLELADEEARPAFRRTLAECLEQASGQRPEVGVARDRVAEARFGREAARGEFLPRVSARGSLGRVDGSDVVSGWQEGAALHINLPLYTGGAATGGLRAADAAVHEAMADARLILDNITLEVTLAHRGIVSVQRRIELARPAVTQARETLRIVRDRFRNGDATPTDVVDAEAALTRAQQRYATATIEYRSALARLAYAMGHAPESLLVPVARADAKDAPSELPPPRRLPNEK